MDNLSHAVAGLAVGELIHRLLPSETTRLADGRRRTLLLTTAALAWNFPDLDLVLTPLLPAPLGYLLHHRGHTHTMLYALPQALLLFAVLLLCSKSARELVRESRHARFGLIVALSTGFCLHLAMDYLNSYGLHPFHPFDARWFYGDMVFILEPMFWVALGVPLALMIARPSLRVLLIVLLLGVPLYFTLQSYLAWFSLLGLYTVAAIVALAQRRAGKRRVGGLLTAVGMLVLFITGQAAASRAADRLVRDALLARPGAARVHDVALTAFPANPLCWAFSSVDSDEEKGSYRLTRGVASIFPRLLPASFCPAALNPASSREAEEDGVLFSEAASGGLEALRNLKAENCFFDAWLRFARIPLLADGVATDIRFASAPRGNFTTLRLQDVQGKSCPDWVPHWAYPRRDLLERGLDRAPAGAG